MAEYKAKKSFSSARLGNVRGGSTVEIESKELAQKMINAGLLEGSATKQPSKEPENDPESADPKPKAKKKSAKKASKKAE